MKIITSNYFDSFIKKIFRECGIEVNIISNIGKPISIIYNHKKILNCRLLDDYLIFTNHYNNGIFMFKIKISERFVLTPELKEQIILWHKTSVHQYCYRIKTKNLSLYLCDYQQEKDSDTDEILNVYPLFAQSNSKYYFSKKFAREILKLNTTKTVELEIV